MPHERRRHDRDISALRQERRIVRPGFDRNLAFLGAERDAKWRSPGFPPATALPKSERTDDLRLQLIAAMPPQNLELGVLEVRPHLHCTFPLFVLPTPHMHPQRPQHSL